MPPFSQNTVTSAFSAEEGFKDGDKIISLTVDGKKTNVLLTTDLIYALNGKKKGDGGTILADKRGYLYAPTFRDWRDTPFPVIDWWWLDSQLTDDEILVVKSHPYGGTVGVKNLKHIVEASRMEPSVNYLYDADVVITDYSSIIFDGYLLGKPAVLFEKNPGYTETRGMYLDYPQQYCSRYARNERELLDLMRSADRLTDTEYACIDYVANACDGHSCERIIKLIYEMNGGQENG